MEVLILKSKAFSIVTTNKQIVLALAWVWLVCGKEIHGSPEEWAPMLCNKEIFS